MQSAISNHPPISLTMCKSVDPKEGSRPKVWETQVSVNENNVNLQMSRQSQKQTQAKLSTKVKTTCRGRGPAHWRGTAGLGTWPWAALRQTGRRPAYGGRAVRQQVTAAPTTTRPASDTTSSHPSGSRPVQYGTMEQLIHSHSSVCTFIRLLIRFSLDVFQKEGR